MTSIETKRNLENQLTAINGRLSDIQRETAKQCQHKQQFASREASNPGQVSGYRTKHRANELSAMEGYSPDYYRYSRHGYPQPHVTEPADTRAAVLPSYGSYVNPGTYSLTARPAPLPPQPQAPPSTKTDMMEMLLMQGAQMQQYAMQQMVMSSLRPKAQTSPALPAPAPGGAPYQAPRGDGLVSINDLFNVGLRRGHVDGRSVFRPEGPPPFMEWQGNRYGDRGPPPAAREPGEQLIPLSVARELLERKWPSTYHHYGPVPEVIGDLPQPDVIPRPMPAPLRPVELLPEQSPPWTYWPPPVVEPEVNNKDPRERRKDIPRPPLIADRKRTMPKASGTQRRFRRVGNVVLFCVRLRGQVTRKYNEEKFQFDIRLREMASTAKEVYTNPNGLLAESCRRLTTEGATDLQALLVSGSTKKQKAAFRQIMDVIRDMANVITGTIPTGGLLGAGGRSAVYQLVQSGVHFPNGYFWDLEQTEFLVFARDGSTHAVGQREAVVLLLGLLVCRALVMKVLLAPNSLAPTAQVKPGSVAASNLKVIASLFVVLCLSVYSRVYKWHKKRQVRLPRELQSQLCTLEDMAKFLKKKRSAMKKVEKQLQRWAMSYYKKLCQLDRKR